MKIFYISLVLMFFSGFAIAKEPIGTISLARGVVSLNGKPVKTGQLVYEGQKLTTGTSSFARVTFAKGLGAIQVHADSEIDIKNEEHTQTVNLTKGALLSVIKPLIEKPKETTYKVKVKSIAMGVRGTAFFTKILANGNVFQCICEGSVENSLQQKIFTSKHHDHHHVLDISKNTYADSPMGDDHGDIEIAELKKLIQ